MGRSLVRGQTAQTARSMQPASTLPGSASPASVQANIPSIQELISRLIAVWLALLP
jgi:hypothetical protein